MSVTRLKADLIAGVTKHHTIKHYKSNIKADGTTSKRYNTYIDFVCYTCKTIMTARLDAFVRSSGTTCNSCSRAEKPRNLKDGRTYDRLYHVWQSMKQRCTNKNNLKFARYGGRGIKIHTEWLDYSVFKAWAEANGLRSNAGLDYLDYQSIDRIDNDGDYTPDNCQLITVSENSYKKTGPYNV